MRSEEEIREKHRRVLQDYYYDKTAGNLTRTQQVQAKTQLKTFEWVLEDEDE